MRGRSSLILLRRVGNVGAASLDPGNQPVLLQAVERVADRPAGSIQFILEHVLRTETCPYSGAPAHNQRPTPVVELLIFKSILIPAAVLPHTVTSRCRFRLSLFDNLQGLSVCEYSYEYQEYNTWMSCIICVVEAHHRQTTVQDDVQKRTNDDILKTYLRTTGNRHTAQYQCNRDLGLKLVTTGRSNRTNL